jgi:hypothetical protein
VAGFVVESEEEPEQLDDVEEDEEAVLADGAGFPPRIPLLVTSVGMELYTGGADVLAFDELNVP